MAFCPKCGKEIAADAAFCPACGFNLKAQPAGAPTPVVAPPAAVVPKPNSHLLRNVGIVVVVVILVIIVLAVLGAAGGGGSSAASITVNGVNLQIVYSNGATSGFLGPNSQSLPASTTLTGGQEFTYTITLNNQASIITTHSVNSFSLNTAGFSLDSVSPTTPYSLGPGATAQFTLTITAPSTNYNGPLNVVVYAS